MRRVGSRETRDPVDAVTGLRIGMSRFRVGLAVVAMTMTVVFTAGGGVANAQLPFLERVITSVCTGTIVTGNHTFTLTADCGPVTEPTDGSQRRHGGRRRAHDHRHRPQRPRTSFNGGVVTNAQGPGAHLMHVNNVIIQAVGFAFHGCAFQTPGAKAFRSDSSSTMLTAPRRTSLFGTSPSTLAAKPATGSVPTRVPGQHARSRSPTSP